MVAVTGMSRNKMYRPMISNKPNSGTESHSESRSESDAASSASSVRLAIEQHGVPLVFESEAHARARAASDAPMLSGHTRSRNRTPAITRGRSPSVKDWILPEAEEFQSDESEPARGRQISPAEGLRSPRTYPVHVTTCPGKSERVMPPSHRGTPNFQRMMIPCCRFTSLSFVGIGRCLRPLGQSTRSTS